MRHVIGVAFFVRLHVRLLLATERLPALAAHTVASQIVPADVAVVVGAVRCMQGGVQRLAAELARFN